MKRQQVFQRSFQMLNGLFLLLLVATMIIPIWNTFIVSVSGNVGSMEVSLKLWPTEFDFNSYATVWNNLELWRPFFNNVIVTVAGTLIHVILCALAAYVLLQNLPGKRIMVSLILFTMMIPSETIMIPLYIVNKEFGLINTLSSLIVAGMASGFSIMLFRNYFSMVPTALSESARIDGAGDFRIFSTIYIPSSLSGLATVVLFEFVHRWNQFKEPLLYINNTKLYTLQIALRSMIDSKGSSSFNIITPNIQAAGIIIALLPLLVIYPFVQKYFVKGSMLGAVKE